MNNSIESKIPNTLMGDLMKLSIKWAKEDGRPTPDWVLDEIAAIEFEEIDMAQDMGF